MIHTFTISYELSPADANFCVHALNAQENKKERWQIESFLNISNRSRPLIFVLPGLAGIHQIKVSKYEDRNTGVKFRIYFMIEPEWLRTGNFSLDLYFSSPEHFKELQTKYARVIFNLFRGAYNGRPAAFLYSSGYDRTIPFTDEEFNRSGLYSLPYLALASIKRIDFTFDAVSEHPKLMVNMIQKSYYQWRKNKKIVGKNRNPGNEEPCYDREFKNNSSAFSIYYKYDKMCDPQYNNYPNIAQVREDSKNIVRIEMPYFNPARSKLGSLTVLEIPEDHVSLGPLTYLVNEQVSQGAFFTEYANSVGYSYDLKWYRTGDGSEFDKKLNGLVEKNKLSNHYAGMIRKLAYAVSQEGSVKRVVELIKANGKIVLTRKRDKQNKQIKEEFKCSMLQYRECKKRATENGLMLLRIPRSYNVKELRATPVLRNYDFSELSQQIISRLLPYQSIREYDVPEMKSVSEPYDAVLSFLYGLYDRYNATNNNRWEEALIPVTDENREKYGL